MKYLLIFVLMIITFGVVLAEDQPKSQDSIVLTSQNGRYKIILQATNMGAGIWITDNRQTPILCLYNGFEQGTAVGTWDGVKLDVSHVHASR